MIHDGKLALRLIEEFLENSIWQSGLKSKTGQVWVIPPDQGVNKNNLNQIAESKFEPVIWLGLPGNNPIQCWSIERVDFEELKNRFAFLGGRNTLNWTTIFGPSADVITTWLFYECGFDEPEVAFEKLSNSCPINLEFDFNTEQFHDLFDSYFSSLF